MANKFNTETIIPVAGGGTHAVDIDSNVQHVVIRPAGAITLSADVNITVSGTPRTNQYVKFLYAGTITSNTASGWTVNIFGHALTDAQALYEAEITALYNGSSWEVKVFPSREGSANLNGSELVTGSVATAAIADDAITNDKLNSITRGSIKVGGASNAPTDLDAKTSGNLLIGDGTDLNSVAMSGDATIDSTGALTIAAGAIEESMLAFTPQNYYSVNTTITTAQILAGCTGVGGTAIQVIPAPGANKLIQIISATAFMDYNSAAYAAGGVVELTSGDGGTTVASASAALLTTASDTSEQFALDTPLLTSGINTAIFFDNASAAFTTGNSDLKLHIIYNIIDFS